MESHAKEKAFKQQIVSFFPGHIVQEVYLIFSNESNLLSLFILYNLFCCTISIIQFFLEEVFVHHTDFIIHIWNGIIIGFI